jgi:hypothetical protein
MNPIDFKDLFDFSNVNEPGKAIELIEKIIAALEKMKINASVVSGQLKQSMDSVSQSAKKLSEQIDGMSAEQLVQAKKQTQALGAEMDTLVATNQKLEKAHADLEQKVKALRAENEKLKKSHQQGAQATEAQEDSMSALEKQIKELTKEYKLLGNTEEKDIVRKKELEKQISGVSTQLEKQRKNLVDVRKESRQMAKETDVASGSLEEMRVKLSQMTRRRNKLQVDSDDFRIAQKEIRTLTDEIKRLEREAGDNRRNVGNYADSIREAFANMNMGGGIPGGGGGVMGIASGLSGIVGMAGPVGIAVAGITTALAGAVEQLERINKVRLDLQSIIGTGGEQLDGFTAKVLALSNTFGLESKEIAQAASSLANQYGVGFGEAVESLEKQLLGAGANSEAVLDIIKEYPVQFKNAGISLEDFTKIAAEAGRQGDFFADKIADSVKEIQLRLSELTPASKKALEGAFGTEFANDIQRRINSGTEPILDIFLDIGKHAKQAGLNTQQLATLTADLGGGPTEDAGGLLRVYETLNKALGDAQEETSELARRQKQNLEVQEEYNQELVALAKNFDGVSHSVEVAFTQALTGALTVLNEILETFQSTSDVIAKLEKGTQEYAKAAKEMQGEQLTDEISRVNEQLEKEQVALQKLTKEAENASSAGQAVRQAFTGQTIVNDLTEQAALVNNLEKRLKALTDQYKSLQDQQANEQSEEQKKRIAEQLKQAEAQKKAAEEARKAAEKAAKAERDREREMLRRIANSKVETTASQTRIGLMSELIEKEKELKEEKSKDFLSQDPQRIAALENEISKLKELTDVQLELPELEKIKTQAAEKESKKRQDLTQEERQAAMQVYDAIDSRIQRSADKRAALLDEELSRQQSLLDAEVRLAEATGQQVDLAAREQKMADLEAQKLENEKKRLRQEEYLSFVKSYQSYLLADPSKPGKALLSAIKDFAQMKAFGGAFKEGVVDFRGEGSEKSDSNVVLISNRESIIKAEASKRSLRVLEDINNLRFDDERYRQLLDLQPINMPQVYQRQMVMLTQPPAPAHDPKQEALLSELKGLRKDVRGLETGKREVDDLLNIIHYIKRGHSTEKRIIVTGKRMPVV